MLVPCMKSVFDPNLSDIMLQCLNVFTENPSVLEYLVTKGKCIKI